MPRSATGGSPGLPGRVVENVMLTHQRGQLEPVAVRQRHAERVAQASQLAAHVAGQAIQNGRCRQPVDQALPFLPNTSLRMPQRSRTFCARLRQRVRSLTIWRR
ncbi:MAG: hypothetical protein OXD44_07425 [Gammaproteobacteria bacterium]|nr:hypothetical protein [Gammaproteobacteria bacterium]